MPLTQTKLATELGDRTEITHAEAKRLLGVLEQFVLAQQCPEAADRPPGQLTVRVKPAQKASK